VCVYVKGGGGAAQAFLHGRKCENRHLRALGILSDGRDRMAICNSSCARPITFADREVMNPGLEFCCTTFPDFQWEPTRPGYLRFLAESKAVFDAFEQALTDESHPECECRTLPSCYLHSLMCPVVVVAVIHEEQDSIL
jgi:hypothetical protein